MNNILTETSAKLLQTINDARQRFLNIPLELWDAKPAANVWSKKEILGHLLDSAANNHLRFVRGQQADSTFVTHGYDQDFFVNSQKYQDTPAAELIELWYAYNRQLAQVIKNVNPNKLKVMCVIGTHEPMTLSFVITDYVTHMQHHLEDIFKTN